MFDFTIIKWKPIELYDDDKLYSHTILVKCKKNGIYQATYYEDSGWKPDYYADHISDPVTPQPTKFWPIPKT